MGIAGRVIGIVIPTIIVVGTLLRTASTGLGYMGQGKYASQRVCILNTDQLSEAVRNKFTGTDFKDSIMDYNGQFDLLKMISYPFNLLGDCLGYGVNYLFYGTYANAPGGFIDYEQLQRIKRLNVFIGSAGASAKGFATNELLASILNFLRQFKSETGSGSRGGGTGPNWDDFAKQYGWGKSTFDWDEFLKRYGTRIDPNFDLSAMDE